MPASAAVASTPPEVAALLDAVSARDLRGRVLASAAWSCVVVAAVVLALGAACRLLGWHPRLLGWPCLAAPPLLALAWAASAQPPDLSRARRARQADAHLASDDLLLSASAPHAGGFASLLAAHASAHARAANARAIVPLRAWEPLRPR